MKEHFVDLFSLRQGKESIPGTIAAADHAAVEERFWTAIHSFFSPAFGVTTVSAGAVAPFCASSAVCSSAVTRQGQVENNNICFDLFLVHHEQKKKHWVLFETWK